MAADDNLFDDGWPPEITGAELAPHYANVKRMLSVVQIPEGQMTGRAKLLARAADAARADATASSACRSAWRSTPRGTTTSTTRSTWGIRGPFVNEHGQAQGTCVHLGNCDIGCDVRAKNTLDLNYIPAAERHGAQVRPLHLVRCVEPEGSGYTVRYDRIADGALTPGAVSADRVVLAAGSLGSTELLLRCRDQFKTLPAVSAALGRRWSANANVFTTAVYGADTHVQQSIGPTITTGMDFMDGSAGGQRFYIEDDGFPNMLLGALTTGLRAGRVNPLAWALQTHLRRGLDEKNPARNMMVWLGEGIDAGDGQLRIGRAPFAPWRKELRLTWDVTPLAPRHRRDHRDAEAALGVDRRALPRAAVLAAAAPARHRAPARRLHDRHEPRGRRRRPSWRGLRPSRPLRRRRQRPAGRGRPQPVDDDRRARRAHRRAHAVGAGGPQTTSVSSTPSTSTSCGPYTPAGVWNPGGGACTSVRRATSTAVSAVKRLTSGPRRRDSARAPAAFSTAPNT